MPAIIAMPIYIIHEICITLTTLFPFLIEIYQWYYYKWYHYKKKNSIQKNSPQRLLKSQPSFYHLSHLQLNLHPRKPLSKKSKIILTKSINFFIFFSSLFKFFYFLSLS